ncbi:hypothetical protein JO965_15375 [Microvirga sp. VF16]|nr:hypothetical protein JO965_15375 [Microvirga sp. VF16]
MRCYFHLVSGHNVIADDTGIDVANLQTAEAEARKAIQELRREGEEADEIWDDWQLNVADAAGRVLLSLPLKAVL